MATLAPPFEGSVVCPLRSSLASNPSQQMWWIWRSLFSSHPFSSLTFVFLSGGYVTSLPKVTAAAIRSWSRPKGEVCMIYMRVYFFIINLFVSFFQQNKNVSFLCLDLDTNCPRRLPPFLFGWRRCDLLQRPAVPLSPHTPSQQPNKALGRGAWQKADTRR